MSALAAQARLLYRELLRGNRCACTSESSLSLAHTHSTASKQFSNYYFREYSLRRTREDFRANRAVTDPKRIMELLDYGRRNLAVIKRQALIGQLYGHQDLVVEAAKRGAARRK